MSVKKFRKKPIVIEAIQCKEPNLKSDVNGFCPTAFENDGGESGLEWFVIPTLEGNHIAMYGDYIIKGVHDEFYPCKPEIFAKTYEEVV